MYQTGFKLHIENLGSIEEKKLQTEKRQTYLSNTVLCTLLNSTSIKPLVFTLKLFPPPAPHSSTPGTCSLLKQAKTFYHL